MRVNVELPITEFIFSVQVQDESVLKDHPEIDTNTIYSYRKKGWDLHRVGKETIYLNELKIWVPKDCFLTVRGVILN